MEVTNIYSFFSSLQGISVLDKKNFMPEGYNIANSSLPTYKERKQPV